jgi:hypothetical protein
LGISSRAAEHIVRCLPIEHHYENSRFLATEKREERAVAKESGLFL